MIMVILSLFWAMLNVADGEISLRWEASNTTPRIGEPFELTLVATYPAEVQLMTWFEPHPRWGDFEILAREESVLGAGLQQQSFKVALWDVGDFQTPEIYVSYRVAGDDRIRERSPEPLFFSVISVLEAGETATLRGNTQPIQPFYIPQIVYVIGGGIVMMIGVAGYRIFRRKQTIINDDIDVPLADGWRVKQSDGLMTSLAPLKTFVGQKLGYAVDHLTHRELLQHMNQNQLVSSQHLERLSQLLAKYDYYRFSDEKPDAQIIGQFKQYTQRWIAMAIDEMEQT